MIARADALIAGDEKIPMLAPPAREVYVGLEQPRRARRRATAPRLESHKLFPTPGLARMQLFSKPRGGYDPLPDPDLAALDEQLAAVDEPVKPEATKSAAMALLDHKGSREMKPKGASVGTMVLDRYKLTCEYGSKGTPSVLRIDERGVRVFEWRWTPHERAQVNVKGRWRRDFISRAAAALRAT